MEKGKDKVKKICDILRRDTLEPAKQEAEALLAQARLDADKIVADARKVALRIEQEAKEASDRQMRSLQSALSQASRQAIEALKQSIEEKMFVPGLAKIIGQKLQEPQIIAQLIDAVVSAIRKEGIDADLSAFIPAAVSADSVNALLVQHILTGLKEKGVLLSSLGGGVEVKLHKENMTIDLSLKAVEELVAGYVRKDFRKWIFAGEQA